MPEKWFNTYKDDDCWDETKTPYIIHNLLIKYNWKILNKKFKKIYMTYDIDNDYEYRSFEYNMENYNWTFSEDNSNKEEIIKKIKNDDFIIYKEDIIKFIKDFNKYEINNLKTAWDTINEKIIDYYYSTNDLPDTLFKIYNYNYNNKSESGTIESLSNLINKIYVIMKYIIK